MTVKWWEEGQEGQDGDAGESSDGVQRLWEMSAVLKHLAAVSGKWVKHQQQKNNQCTQSWENVSLTPLRAGKCCGVAAHKRKQRNVTSHYEMHKILQLCKWLQLKVTTIRWEANQHRHMTDYSTWGCAPLCSQWWMMIRLNKFNQGKQFLEN